MNKFVAIRYIDALYYTETVLDYTVFPVHITVGNLIDLTQDILISFTERNGEPCEGLRIPKKALVLNEKKEDTLSDLSFRVGLDIGLYWKDVVHFTDCQIPEACTPMYSEGLLLEVTSDAYIIKDPNTIKIGKKIANHPLDGKPTFIVIPKSFVTDIKFYDNKL